MGRTRRPVTIPRCLGLFQPFVLPSHQSIAAGRSWLRVKLGGSLPQTVGYLTSCNDQGTTWLSEVIICGFLYLFLHSEDDHVHQNSRFQSDTRRWTSVDIMLATLAKHYINTSSYLLRSQSSKLAGWLTGKEFLLYPSGDNKGFRHSVNWRSNIITGWREVYNENSFREFNTMSMYTSV